MNYVICGFILGFIIPYMARRFAKFMPASAAESIWRLICSGKRIAWQKRLNNQGYKKLLSAYFWRSFMYALVCSALFYCAVQHFGSSGLWGILAFIWALVLLFEIDYKTMLLPDVVTVPLLIGGFVFASFYGAWIASTESAIGAVIGYVLPVVAALFVVWKHSDAFGGGDIKLLSAVGAWLGGELVIYVIILAAVLFSVYALIMRKRSGAFGPAIAVAAIIVAFYFF